MTNPLKLSFSDLVAIVLFHHFITDGYWSWWYLVLILFWGRFHILRRRLWHAIQNKARTMEIDRKLKNAKTTAVLIVLISLCSCQKEYTCTATMTIDIYGTPTTVSTTKEVTGKKERDNFIDQNEQAGATVTCK